MILVASMSSYNDKKFIALKRKWYQKLKKAGFDDIEVMAKDGNLYDLLRYPLRFDPSSPERIAQQKYFNLARSFIYDYKFKNKFEKKCWEFHAEGLPYRKIASILKKDRNFVYNIILRIRKKMVEIYTVND